MKIVDISKDVISRREKLGKVEKIAKKFFNDCKVSSFGDYIVGIDSFSGKSIAYVNLLIGSGSIVLMNKSYEKKAIAFAKEYEKKILGKSLDGFFSRTFGEGFLLEKDYSENK